MSSTCIHKHEDFREFCRCSRSLMNRDSEYIGQIYRERQKTATLMLAVRKACQAIIDMIDKNF
jgi:hypothetical protein